MRLKRLIATTAALLLGMLGAVAVSAATATPANASCSTAAHSNDDTRSGQFFNGNYINIHTGPYTGCTSLGQGQLTHTVDYWCFTYAEQVTANGLTMATWTYLKDVTTGVSGWVSDTLLDYRDGTHGSNKLCRSGVTKQW